MTIATHSHRAPTAAAGTRGVVEEKLAQGIGTASNGRAGTFDQEFRGGTSNRSEKPVQAAFPADKLKRPGSFVGDKFIVALGHAEDFVDGFNPGGGERITIHDRCENGAERFAESQDAEENSIDSVRFGGKKWPEPCSPIVRNESRIHKKGNKFVPGEVMGGGREIGEIESEPARDEMVRRLRRIHITGGDLQGGYSRMAPGCKGWVERNLKTMNQ